MVVQSRIQRHASDSSVTLVAVKRLTLLGICGVALATGMAVLACSTATPSGPGRVAPGVSAPSTVSVSASTLLTVLPPVSSAPVSGAAQRMAFLAALDGAGIPRSKSGDAEMLIGRGVCGQLAEGKSPDAIAADLSGSVPWNHGQALTVVRAAQRVLC